MEEITIECIRICRVCHRVISFDVPLDGYMRWQAGELIQIAMPHLSANHRELLISETCPKCWDKMFGIEQSEEESDGKKIN